LKTIFKRKNKNRFAKRALMFIDSIPPDPKLFISHEFSIGFSATN
jgi:hypothetical protein